MQCIFALGTSTSISASCHHHAIDKESISRCDGREKLQAILQPHLRLQSSRAVGIGTACRFLLLGLLDLSATFDCVDHDILLRTFEFQLRQPSEAHRRLMPPRHWHRRSWEVCLTTATVYYMVSARTSCDVCVQNAAINHWCKKIRSHLSCVA